MYVDIYSYIYIYIYRLKGLGLGIEDPNFLPRGPVGSGPNMSGKGGFGGPPNNQNDSPNTIQNKRYFGSYDSYQNTGSGGRGPFPTGAGGFGLGGQGVSSLRGYPNDEEDHGGLERSGKYIKLNIIN
jgi:hypothetical protein